MQKLALLTALLAAVIACCDSSAALIARDLLAPGDGLITYDSVNRREWLDMPETLLKPLDAVRAQTRRGERYQGFRFATLADVLQLLNAAEVPLGAEILPPRHLGPQPKIMVESLGVILEGSGGLMPPFEVTGGRLASSGAVGTSSAINMYVWILKVDHEPLLPPGAVPHPLFSGPWVGGEAFINHSWPFGFSEVLPVELRDNGPFWMYRDVVPEPNSTTVALVLLGTVLVSSFKRQTLR